VGLRADLRERVVPERRGCRVASLQRRLLVLLPSRLLLGLQRAVGMGALPLRPLGLRQRARLGLVPGQHLRRRLGLLVLGLGLHRLGAARLLERPGLLPQHALSRLLRPVLLELRPLRPHRGARLPPVLRAREPHPRPHRRKRSGDSASAGRSPGPRTRRGTARAQLARRKGGEGGARRPRAPRRDDEEPLRGRRGSRRAQRSHPQGGGCRPDGTCAGARHRCATIVPSPPPRPPEPS